MTRVASSSLHLQNLKDISTVQGDLARLNKQISSGLKASTFDEMSGIVERVSGYEMKLSRIDTYSTNNKSVMTRLQTMDQKISTIQDVAADFASLLALRRNPAAANGINFQSQANQLLGQIKESLNTTLEGRYIFSGSSTDTPPIPDPLAALTDVGVPDDNYYAGNNAIVKARVSDSLEIEYGVTASNPAFQELFAAIQTAITGDAQNNDAYLSKAVDLVNSAVESLASLRSDVNADITTVTSINDDHDKFKIYWKEAVSDETSTDIAEATIRLSVDQTILQATFQAFAKLSGLKLTDFLR